MRMRSRWCWSCDRRKQGRRLLCQSMSVSRPRMERGVLNTLLCQLRQRASRSRVWLGLRRSSWIRRFGRWWMCRSWGTDCLARSTLRSPRVPRKDKQSPRARGASDAAVLAAWVCILVDQRSGAGHWCKSVRIVRRIRRQLPGQERPDSERAFRLSPDSVFRVQPLLLARLFVCGRLTLGTSSRSKPCSSTIGAACAAPQALRPRARRRSDCACEVLHSRFELDVVRHGRAGGGRRFRFFGYVVGMEAEWGYFLLSELQAVRGGLGLPIERDLYFTPQPISAILGGAK